MLELLDQGVKLGRLFSIYVQRVREKEENDLVDASLILLDVLATLRGFMSDLPRSAEKMRKIAEKSLVHVEKWPSV